MPKFSDPFSGINSNHKLTKEETIRAIREMIATELEAANLYQQLSDNITDKKTQEVLRSVANEELVHIGEFQKALFDLNPEEESYYNKGIKEANKIKATDEVNKIRKVLNFN